MKTLSLQWRIALAYTVLILVSVGAVSLYLVSFVRDSYLSALQERLDQEAGLVAETTTRYFRGPLDAADLQVAAARTASLIGARVTIMGRDGTVLADSWEDPAQMENHSGRPEFQDALRGGLGRSTRTSATVGQELRYTAVAISVDGTLMGVARIAVPTSSIHANVRRITTTVALAAVIVVLLAVALSIYLARRASRSIRLVADAARRLSAGDLEARAEALASDETRELADAFNHMAASLKTIVGDLSLERNKLSAVLDTMADSVIVIQGDGRVGLLNRATEELLQVTARQAVGRRFMEVIRDHELQRLLSHAVETGTQQYGEVELLHRRRYLTAVATPLRGEIPSGVLLTLHDLTQARQIDTTRREFVSNVSHELRTPLASIKAMVETLESGALQQPEVAADFTGRIHREVDRLTNLAEDLLELSSLESGRVSLELRPVDLVPLINEAVAQLRAAADAKGVGVDANLHDSVPQVMGEADKLRQVVVNFLDNAIKFTPEGGKITVSARGGERSVEVSVADTGIGIPQEHLAHVFERFYKVDRSRRYGGTGLGLAIAKHIVQEYGGEVGVESREGEGSRFWFTVPVAR